jgi:hypothetical protein
MATRARYRGRLDANGVPQEFLNGIPASDIDEDQWQQLDSEQRAAVREARRGGDGKPLYDVATDREMSGGSPAKAKRETEPKAEQPKADAQPQHDEAAAPPQDQEGGGS